jgi:hypothetical protein
MTTDDYLSNTVLLLASTMTILNYYVLGDDTDFCFPIYVERQYSIMQVGLAIQKNHWEYLGIKLVLPKLFEIDELQDKLVDIVAALTGMRCMAFRSRVDNYYEIEDIQSGYIHILVITGRE